MLAWRRVSFTLGRPALVFLFIRAFLKVAAELDHTIEVPAGLLQLLCIHSARRFDDRVSYEQLDLLADQDQFIFRFQAFNARHRYSIFSSGLGPL